MNPYRFFDYAATTQCCEEALERLKTFSHENYGNPSSSHFLGQKSARAIHEARTFFGETFRVEPDQVVFTGSGTEANNMALYGIALPHSQRGDQIRVISSAIEHPAIGKSAESLRDFGIEVEFAPVDSEGKIRIEEFEKLLTPNTALVSIMRVNNIIGAVQDIEALAEITKKKVPGALFHSDCIQGLGKVPLPTSQSKVDLISLSAHKIYGPKGVGALIFLNRGLLNPEKFRPLIWGGGQEFGMRSGTQSPGLISAFHIAAKRMLEHMPHANDHVAMVAEEFRKGLKEKGLLSPNRDESRIRWNSPENAVPHIVSLSVPGFPTGPLSSFLEERGCLIATGSACSAKKVVPDKVLQAIGLPAEDFSSTLRVSFSNDTSVEDVRTLVDVLANSISQLEKILCPKTNRSPNGQS